MNNPELGSDGASAEQGKESNPAEILTQVPGAESVSAEILTEVPEAGIAETKATIVALGNETSTDRVPGDNLSPEADASKNDFERDPNDSTDITAEFDDKKAQEIEQQLAVEDTGLEPVLDVKDGAEYQEIEPSPQDYEHFSQYYLAYLYGQLNTPGTDPERIYEGIAVLPNLINMITEPNLSDPASVFQSIGQTYIDLAQKAREEGQDEVANKQDAYADQVAIMATHFNEFMRKRPNMPAEKNSDHETPIDPNNPLTSGPWIE